MSTPFSTPSMLRRRTVRAAMVAAAALVAAAPAAAQHVVFDPRNHLENALQTARQLESLANEARSLAASPYSHLAQNSQALREMADLARSVEGLGAAASDLERQVEALYATRPDEANLADLLREGRGRQENARRTALDLARHAAALERLGQGRDGRLSGALSASQSAAGQTAAVQSSNQILAVLAEDLSALRVVMLAQSRLLAEQAARRSADEAAGDAARRRAWSREVDAPPPPAFNPFPRARD